MVQRDHRVGRVGRCPHPRELPEQSNVRITSDRQSWGNLRPNNGRRPVETGAAAETKCQHARTAGAQHRLNRFHHFRATGGKPYSTRSPFRAPVAPNRAGRRGFRSVPVVSIDARNPRPKFAPARTGSRDRPNMKRLSQFQTNNKLGMAIHDISHHAAERTIRTHMTQVDTQCRLLGAQAVAVLISS